MYITPNKMFGTLLLKKVWYLILFCAGKLIQFRQAYPPTGLGYKNFYSLDK
jgi:hypothetical protein